MNWALVVILIILLLVVFFVLVGDGWNNHIVDTDRNPSIWNLLNIPPPKAARNKYNGLHDPPTGISSDSTRSTNNQRTLVFVNNCSDEIHVGALGNAGKTPPLNGGWLMMPGARRVVNVPLGWAGRFWGRTHCNTTRNGNSTQDGNLQFGRCATGDCGGLECAGRGGEPPATLVEMTLDDPNSGRDFYDISLVDGYNIGISITPSTAASQTNPQDCGAPSCVADINSICPQELQVRFQGQVVACKSACTAFNTDQYCCRGAYGTPENCDTNQWRINSAQLFKNACPTAYSHAFDDPTSTFTCPSMSDNYRTIYTIAFCSK